MYTVSSEGLIVDPESGRPVARPVDSFTTALGEATQSDLVIFRLYQKGAASSGGPVQPDQVHQFVMSARRAAELGRHLLELAAQVEKEGGAQQH